MNIKSLAAAAAIVVVSGTAFAQQTEFVAPDASFHSSRTRAEVRSELVEAEKIGATAWQMVDGENVVRQAGTLSRQQVRDEALTALKMHRPGDVNDIYFGG